MQLPADWDIEELMIPHVLRCSCCRVWLARWRRRRTGRPVRRRNIRPGDPGE